MVGVLLVTPGCPDIEVVASDAARLDAPDAAALDLDAADAERDGSVLTCVDGACRAPLPCISDSTCDRDEHCTFLAGIGSVCVARGAVEVDGACATSAECAAGYCLDRVCVALCRSNMDCPPELVCATRDPRFPTACVANCISGICADPTQACAPSGCIDPGCRDDADCAAGEDCLFSYESFSGHCTSGSTVCIPGEVLLLEFQPSGWCSDGRGCWLDAPQCNAGYWCAPFGGEDVGFCRRE